MANKGGDLKGMTPTLVVGLGGTGMEVVMRLRKLVLQKYGDFQRVPILSFLVIDTDTNYELTETSLILPSTRLQDSERVDATVPDPLPLYEGIERGKEQFDYLAEWFCLDRLKGITNVTDGAGQIRQMGRLCFFHNYTRIRDRLTQAEKRLRLNKNHEYMREVHNVEVDPGLNVYLVCSLAGGTGAGMFLDMAYLVRHLFPHAESRPVRRVAFLVMPDAFEGLGDRVLANGYAALKELNYYSYNVDRNDPQYPLFGQVGFSAQYTEEPTSRVQCLGEPPFDFCYLVGSSNSAGVNFTRGQLFDMLARNLFLEFTSKVAAWKRSMRDNIRPLTLKNDSLGCPQRYLTFGLSSIYFPSHQIAATCSYRLAQKVVGQLRRALRSAVAVERPDQVYADSDVDEYVKKVLEEGRYIEAASRNRYDLSGPLALTSRGKRIAEVAEEWKSWVLGQSDSEQWDRGEWYNRLHNATQAFARRFDDSNPSPERWGDYMTQMYRNMQEQQQRRQAQLVNDLAVMVEDRRQGPDYALVFLERLVEKLKETAESLRQDAANPHLVARLLGDVVLKKVRQGSGKALDALLAAAMESELHEVQSIARNPLVFQWRRALRKQTEDYLFWASAYFRARAEIKSRRLAAQMLDGLADEMQKQKGRVQELQTLLRQLGENLEKFEEEYLAHMETAEIAGEKLYDKTLVEAIYQEYVPDESASITTVLERVMEDPQLVPAGKRLRLLDFPEIARTRPGFLELLRERVYHYCEKHISGHFLGGAESEVRGRNIDEITAAELLADRYPDDQELARRVGNVYDQSAPFLRFLAALPDGGWTPNVRQRQTQIGIYGGYTPPESKGPEGTAAPTAAERKKARLLEALSQLPEVSLEDNIKAVPDRNQILFVREEGGFPLRRIQGLDQLKEAYEALRSRPGESPLHITAQADRFPDLFPPDPEVMDEARRCAFLGVAVGLIERTEEGGFLYHFLPNPEVPDIEIPKHLGADEVAVVRNLFLDEEVRARIARHLQDYASEHRQAESREAVSRQIRDALEEKARSAGGKGSPLYQKYATWASDYLACFNAPVG